MSRRPTHLCPVCEAQIFRADQQTCSKECMFVWRKVPAAKREERRQELFDQLNSTDLTPEQRQKLDKLLNKKIDNEMPEGGALEAIIGKRHE